MAHSSSNPGVLYQTPHCAIDIVSSRDTQPIYTLSHARAKSRSLESANDTKTGEQIVFGEIHTNHAFEMP